MLVSNFPAGQRQAAAQPAPAEFIGLSDIIAFLRQYLASIVAFTLAGALLAFFYVTTTAPVFSARTQILIEPKLPQFLSQDGGGVNTSLDTAQIESQIAVMRSEKIARMVIDDLGLMQEPAFMQAEKPTFGERLGLFAAALRRLAGIDAPAPETATPQAGAEAEAGTPEAGAEAEAEAPAGDPEEAAFERGRHAIGVYQRDLDVRRVGISYAVEIHFRSTDPELAANVANATAENFVREQIETKAASAREGGEWMEQRLAELRTQMNTATQIAQEFRSRHDYSVQPPGARLVEGQLVYDGSGQGAPTLEELEVTADTYRKMYESFLQAFMSNLSQQTYAVADARIISAATRPLAPTHPRRKLILAFGLVAGSVVGVGLAFVRHALDPTIRSVGQIREDLGLACLGELPAVRGRNGGFGLLDEVAASPRSAFSEHLRRVKASIELLGTGQPTLRFIGITSSRAGEGKTATACNLALLYATSGLRTLLVDADVEHASLTRKLIRGGDGAAPCSPAGVDGVRTVMTPTAKATLELLPAAAGAGVHAPGALPTLLPDLAAYDLVIFDLPPLSSGTDKLAIARPLDGVVVVAEWGRTPLAVVRELIWALEVNRATAMGVVMTRVRRRFPKPQSRRRFRPAR